MKRIDIPLVTLMLAMAASVSHAEADKSVTRLLLEKDAQIAVQKADQELAKTNPAPAVVTPAPTANQEVRTAPKTVAVFGMDGSKAGLPVTLRSYVKWGSEVYPAKVGGTVRGYKVVAITESGTTLSKGKHTLMAARADDEVVLSEEPAPRGGASAGRPAEPLPGHSPAAAIPSFPPSMPVPLPGMSNGAPGTLPTASPVPPAPATTAVVG